MIEFILVAALALAVVSAANILLIALDGLED
jgi:hypothetical protein